MDLLEDLFFHVHMVQQLPKIFNVTILQKDQLMRQHHMAQQKRILLGYPKKHSQKTYIS